MTSAKIRLWITDDVKMWQKQRSGTQAAAEYPLHQLIRLGHLEIDIAFFKSQPRCQNLRS